MFGTARRILLGHRRLFVAAAIGFAALLAAPAAWDTRTQGIFAWDVGALALLLLSAVLFLGAAPAAMEANAVAQEEGEWTLFWLVVAGVAVSFTAVIGEFGSMKGAAGAARDMKVTLVAVTLLLSWLLTHTQFALRYAHEFYTRTNKSPTLDGGLEFPKQSLPDYWDFFYFAAVLGMTFQVSDVQITSRKLRRLATLHGLLSFMFNTVIVALMVNLAAGLLN
ncbi:MAG: DUF1345 domain-containing protein [Rhodospirillales bacterium]